MRDERPSASGPARELTTLRRDLADGDGVRGGRREPRVLAGGRSLPLRDAERRGLVQVLRYGGATKIVATGGSDVRVELPAGGTATVRDLTEKGAGAGAARSRSRAATSVALGGSGAVTAGGKALKPSARDKKAPVTRATVKRAGGKVRLTLGARRLEGRRDLRVRGRQAPRLQEAARARRDEAGEGHLRLRRRLGQRRDRPEGT